MFRPYPTVRPRSLHRERALRLTEGLSATTQLVASLEYLVDAGERFPGGLNDPGILRFPDTISSPTLRRLVSFAARPPVTRAVHLARTVAAASLLLPAPRRSRVAANAFLAGSQAILHPTNQIGGDGSDQASFLVQSLATIARAGQRSPGLVDACLWYLAAQSAHNYATSGWTKLLSPRWRSGAALAGIMRTRGFGDERVWRLLNGHPLAGRALGVSVLAMESLFPVVLLGRGRRLAPLFVGAAAAFHGVNARVMGLNRFLPAFVAMHPALLYVTGPRQRRGPDGRIERRDDLMPSLLAVGGAGAALAALASHVRRRRTVVRGRDDEQAAMVSSGNVLRLRRTGPAGAGTPVLVCESGLVGTGEHWEWIGRRLSQRYDIVTYQRAGYGGSTLAARAGTTLDAAVDDLVDLATQQAGDRPLVLMGHSLGGYLAWRAAARLGTRVRAVVVIDSSHPRDIRRALDEGGGDDVAAVLSTKSTWLRLGFGMLADPPRWLPWVPDEVRSLMDAQYRDPGAWIAARREWGAAAQLSAGERLASLHVPALVISASMTAERLPAALESHRAMAAAAPRSVHHVVPDSDHDRLLLAAPSARRVAALVEEFLDGIGDPRCDAAPATLARR